MCVAYLKKRGTLDYGPERITVFDFDQRIVNAIQRFADREHLGSLDARRYNCVDGLPSDARHDLFHTNPPWGPSNEGASVHLFAQRTPLPPFESDVQ